MMLPHQFLFFSFVLMNTIIKLTTAATNTIPEFDMKRCGPPHRSIPLIGVVQLKNTVLTIRYDTHTKNTANDNFCIIFQNEVCF